MSASSYDPQPEVDRLDEAMELMHFAFRRVLQASDALLASRGLGRLHHRLLYVVGRNPGADVGRCVELLGITKQALHQPLRDLVERDLIRPERHPADGRRKQLVLSPAGRELERTLAGLQHDVFARAFAEAGPEATEGWRAVMDSMGEGRRLRG